MHNKVLSVISLLLASVVLLSYNDDPPNGRTGAPFDGHCRDCHSSNNPYNFNGLAEIVGLPDTVQPNTIYLLQLQVTATAGQPLKAGFQLIIVDKNGDNAGDLMAINNESDTDFLSGRGVPGSSRCEKLQRCPDQLEFPLDFARQCCLQRPAIVLHR